MNRILFFLPLLALFSCKPETPPVTDPLADLNLPETPFNYAMPNLPAHMLAPQVANADNTPANNPVTDQGATLGRVLFYDKNLSSNKTIACASCHVSTKGLSDDKALSEGFEGGQTGRNSMSLANARYYANGRFFWDERAASLEVQTLLPIQDGVEMGLTLDELIARLQDTEYYPVLFKNAFGSEAITSDKVSKALSQFVRSMISYRSKYDAGRAQVANAGDPFPNFTPQENEGKALFLNPNIGCAACHGTDAHIAPGPRNNGLDATTTDAGVGGANGRPQDQGRFKVNSLRNIALTAPYMHDGRFTTLAQVITHYNGGVQSHPSLDPPLRLPNGQPRRLNLTVAQMAALEAFLHTLTDTEMLADEKFSSPF
jgi:cytochrome c peroxidase